MKHNSICPINHDAVGKIPIETALEKGSIKRGTGKTTLPLIINWQQLNFIHIWALVILRGKLLRTPTSQVHNED